VLACPVRLNRKPAADIIITNAKVWTVDPSLPTAQAVAVLLAVTLRDPISSYESGYQRTKESLSFKFPFTALVAFDDMTAFVRFAL